MECDGGETRGWRLACGRQKRSNAKSRYPLVPRRGQSKQRQIQALPVKLSTGVIRQPKRCAKRRRLDSSPNPRPSSQLRMHLADPPVVSSSCFVHHYRTKSGFPSQPAFAAAATMAQLVYERIDSNPGCVTSGVQLHINLLGSCMWPVQRLSSDPPAASCPAESRRCRRGRTASSEQFCLSRCIRSL